MRYRFRRDETDKMKQSIIYILTNKNKTTLYIGVTNNLQRRLSEHIKGIGSKFTKWYNVHYLIYYEKFEDITLAIEREKQLNKWSRCKKVKLIERVNPYWEYLDDSRMPTREDWNAMKWRTTCAEQQSRYVIIRIKTHSM